MKALVEKVLFKCAFARDKVINFLHENANVAAMAMGVGLIAIGTAQIATAGTGEYDEQIVYALGRVFEIIEGSFGALVMVVAGLAAVVAAAMGAYKAALGCLVVAVGSFVVRAMVHLFFGGTVSSDNMYGAQSDAGTWHQSEGN